MKTWNGPTPQYDERSGFWGSVDRNEFRREGYRAAMNSPDVRQMAEALRKTQREINHMPVDERDASPMILQIWEWGGKALAGYEAGLKEATNA